MRRAATPARALLVLALLVAPALLPDVDAQATTRVLRWDYTVRVDDPASSTVHVTLRFAGLKGLVERMGFQTGAHAYAVGNVTSDQSRLVPGKNGVDLVVERDVESFSFTVNVNRAATKPGEYNAYLGPDWGVFKSEAFALGFNYSYLEGTPFRWESGVRFVLPAGWTAEMPYARAGPSSFALPKEEVLPRGFVAMGPLSVTSHEAAGKEFRLVRIGKALSYANDVFPYLERSTPYYAQVYGPVAGDVLLAVSAPSPMFHGGLGGTDSLYVHESSDIRTFAHEHAHVWQLFATVGEPGRSTLWVNEGDAEYHGVLSLFVTDYWSLAQVNDFLRDYHDERTREPFRSARLPEASYGTDLEDVAYHKGALVLRALDAAMLEATHGASGVADVLRALNRAHDQRVRETVPAAQQARMSPVTNEEVLLTVNRIVQESASYDFTPFFQDFVYGARYPEFQEVRTRENLVLANMTVTPARALASEPVTVSILLENRGIAPASRRVPLLLDGVQVDARDVTVPVGRSETVTFVITAPASPGAHQLRSFYLEQPLHVLTPARLTVARVATTPTTVTAGQPAELLVYVANAGELEGLAQVAVRVGGRLVGERQETVPGNVTRALSFPLTLLDAGPQAVEVRLAGEGAEATQDLTIEVAPPDADADGVPDHLDAYPRNARLTEKSIGNDVKNAVPGVAVAWALAALVVAALAARRR